MTAKLHIARAPRGYRDSLRSYDVVVNGQVRAQLRRGEATTIEVDPGHVEIYIEVDWGRSRVVGMSLDPGAEAQLLCSPRTALTALYGITFGRNNYVRLEPAQSLEWENFSTQPPEFRHYAPLGMRKLLTRPLGLSLGFVLILLAAVGGWRLGLALGLWAAVLWDLAVMALVFLAIRERAVTRNERSSR